MIERKELGWLMIDDRLSGGKLLEASTFTCTHCGAVVVMNPERTRERTKCHGCRHLICDNCAAVYSQTHECKTLAQVIDEQFEQTVHGGDTPLVLLP
jgi:hypothetical protein